MNDSIVIKCVAHKIPKIRQNSVIYNPFLVFGENENVQQRRRWHNVSVKRQLTQNCWIGPVFHLSMIRETSLTRTECTCGFSWCKRKIKWKLSIRTHLSVWVAIKNTPSLVSYLSEMVAWSIRQLLNLVSRARAFSKRGLLERDWQLFCFAHDWL